MGAFRLLTRVVAYGKIAILARILSPEQFGLFGIAVLALALLEILTETGINVFLIQEKKKIDEYLDTAWIISIARGIIISALIVVSAGLVANFFNNPEVKPLIILISAVPLIRGFINPAVVSLQKDLRFRSEFYLRTTIFAIDTVVSVAIALHSRSAASLVYGVAAGAIAEVVLTHLLITPRPKLAFSSAQTGKIIKRGKWITLAGTSNYLVEHADDAMVGRIVGTSSLGIYQMAYKLSLLPLTEVTQVIGKVSFPVYVKISGDINRLKKAFIKTALATTAIATLMGLVLFLGSGLIVRIILGPAWTEAIPILRVLSIFGVLRAASSVQFVLFNSLKKQRLVAISLLIEFAALFAVLVPLITRHGTIGAAYATLFAVIVPMPFIALNSYKILFRK